MNETITNKVIYSNKLIKTIRKRVPSHKITSESLRLGIVLAIVGGFLDAYTYISRGGVFANAETGNIVLLSLRVTSGNYMNAMMAAIPILFFIFGVIATEAIRDFTVKKYDGYEKAEKLILVIEAIVLFIIGFVPESIPNIFVTSTIAFVSSVQISSFRRLVDSPYTTTMCTGNIRTASQSAYLAIAKKDREASTRAIRYTLIILAFLLGASIGGGLTSFIGVKSVWLCSLLLILAKVMYSIDEHRYKK